MYPEQYWSWHTWWVFPMFMPIFWIIIIVLCLYFIFGRGGSRKPWEPGQGQETALDILKKRYAKGEISKAEFEQMKRDIMS
jgi:putative membrane protein